MKIDLPSIIEKLDELIVYNLKLVGNSSIDAETTYVTYKICNAYRHGVIRGIRFCMGMDIESEKVISIVNAAIFDRLKEKGLH